MNMTSASEKVKSGDMPSEFVAAAIVITIIYLICCFVAPFTKYQVRSALLDLFFGFNIGVETYVTTAAQFQHADLLKKKLAGWAMASAFGGLICIFGDIYLNTRNSLTMQGQRLLVDVRAHQPVLARPHQNCLQIGFNKARNVGKTLIDSSWEDKLRIGAGIVQFLLRMAELFSRLFCSVHICTLLQEDFTAVPLLLAVLSSSKRIVRKCRSDVTVISCLFVGDLLRGVPDPVPVPVPAPEIEDPVPVPEIEDPSSTVLRGIRGNNNIEMTNYTAISFDMWTTHHLRSNTGIEMDFTMMEMRGRIYDNNNNQEWYIPPADFVILYFSLTDQNSYNNITENCQALVRDRVRRARIILVGTGTVERTNNQNAGLFFVSEAQGVQLAYTVNAVTYVECNTNSHIEMTNLLLKFIELAN